MSPTTVYHSPSTNGTNKNSASNSSSYHHLTLEQRHYIALRRSEGASQKMIAKALGVAPSTVSREVRRLDPNAYGPCANYNCYDAQLDYRRKRQNGGYKGKSTFKNDKGELVTTTIRHDIKIKKFSPKQVANRTLRQPGQVSISKATIYRWIHKGKIYDLSCQDLRRKGKKKQKSNSYTEKYIKGRSISERPKEIDDRNTFGHFEADSILSSRTGKGRAFTLVERMSRYTFASIQKIGTAKNFVKFVKKVINKHGNIIKSITVDRGSEFACWEEIEAMGIEIYFCDPYSSNQKGQIEHMNGELRWFFPKDTDFSKVSQKTLYKDGIRVINNFPREVLGWRTSSEVFHSELRRIAAKK